MEKKRSAPHQWKEIHNSSSWDQEIPVPALPFYGASFVVTSLALVAFFNSLNGDFVFDDSEAIVNNQDVRSDTPLINIFRNDFWGTRLTHPSSHKSYRPLTVFSFRLNFLIGGLDPFSFHVFNLVLHCVVSVMSLRVFSVLLGNRCPRAAFLSSILFCTHPVHTEAVSGIVGRADLLCCLFVFIALLTYVHLIEQTNEWQKQKKEVPWMRMPRSIVCSYVLVALSTAIAMLCKEVGITVLGLCSSYDILVANRGYVARYLVLMFLARDSTASFNKQLPGSVRYIVVRHLFLLFLGLILFSVRWVVMGSTVPKFMVVDNPASFLDSLMFRSLNYQYVYSLNCLLMFLPIWLCFDWSMGCVPLITSPTDPRLLALLFLWGGVGCLLYRGVTCNGKSSRYILVSLSLAVVPFIPASNLFFRVGFVMAERVLYIPVAGLCILVVVGIRELRASNVISKRSLQVSYVILVLAFILRCRQRNSDWLTEKQLFQSGLDVCPLNAKVHYNLGKVAADAGDTEEAVSRYQEALRLNNNYDQAMNNLANILKEQGLLDEALQLLLTATSLRPEFAAAWMNLGIIQASLGRQNDAEESYLTALKHRSVYPDCLYNLGNLYLDDGENSKALDAWKNATSLKPSLTVAWTNMLILLDSEGQYEEAVEIANQALKFLPNEPALHFNLANTLGKLGQYENSEKYFLKATSLDPNNASYWANLGVLYHRWKRFDLAEKAYRHSLALSPDMKSAKQNLSMLLKSLAKGKGSTQR